MGPRPAGRSRGRGSAGHVALEWVADQQISHRSAADHMRNGTDHAMRILLKCTATSHRGTLFLGWNRKVAPRSMGRMEKLRITARQLASCRFDRRVCDAHRGERGWRRPTRVGALEEWVEL